MERQTTLDFAIKELAEKGTSAGHLEDNFFSVPVTKKFSTNSVRDNLNYNRNKMHSSVDGIKAVSEDIKEDLESPLKKKRESNDSNSLKFEDSSSESF